MNGFKTIQILRDNPQTTDIPIVVVSVVQEEEQLTKLGVADVLDKPIDEDAYLQAVERILGKGIGFDLCFRRRDPAGVGEVLSQRGYHLIFAQDGVDLLVQARKELAKN